ncbi:MAG: methyl-accepting chemotaxis protein [Elainellaceae cyanobacterium]
MTQVPYNSTTKDAVNTSALPDWADSSQVQDTSLGTSIDAQQNPWAGINSTRSATLGRQLLATVLPLTLAPLAVASFAGYTITQNRVQTQVNDQLEGQALLASGGISQALEENLELTAGLATNPLVSNLTQATNEIVEADGLPQRPIASLENQFSSTKQIERNQALNDYLARLAETEGLSEVILTESNGLNVGYSRTPSTFVQYRNTWWQQGKAQGQWISDPEYNEAVESLGISLSQRVEDPSSGEFLGILKTFVPSQSFGFLMGYLDNAGISGSQQVQLIDISAGSALATFTAEGQTIPESLDSALQIVGGRTIAEVAARAVESVRGVQVTSEEDLVTELQTAYPIQDIQVRELTFGEEQGFIISFDFEGKQYAVSTMPQVDWVAIASIDISEVRAEGRGLIGIFGLIAAVLGGLGALVTVGLSNRLSSPLIDLSAKARQVSAGNLNVTAEPKGTAEAQTLAQTFNDLVLRVKGFLGEQTLNAQKANLLAEITGANIVSSAELGSVFNQVVAEARTILNSDRVVVYQFDPNWNGWIAAESVEANLVSAYDQGLSDSCIPEETREKYLADGLLMVNDVNAAEFHPEHLQLLRNLDVQSLVAVPIKAQGRLYGLVIAHHCRSRHSWQPSEVDFLIQLGLQVGLVIDRVQLLEQTEALAEEQRQIKEGLQRNALQLLMDVDPVSQGDLTVRAKVTEDEIGTIADSYNAMITSLRKIVSQVKTAAEQVVTTTDTNDQSVRAMSTSAMQQADEIAAALDQAQEMANSVRQVAENAKKAELAVQQASQTVQEGDQAMNRTVDGIMAIRETVAETAKKVKRLGESSQKISNVVNLISGFAAQTNMLALNASIEASRAGEGGKGFAVVAEEVRELARQSADATTEIEKLVAGIQAETNEVVLAMETGTEQVVNGTELVDETRQSLNRITAASQQINILVEAITQVTTVQSKASEAVTASMTNVAAIANRNSQEANQVSSSFEELNAVAQALQEEVGRFKVN